jgi:hypothetical protein
MRLKHETAKSDDYSGAQNHIRDVDATSRIAAGRKRKYRRHAKVMMIRTLRMHPSGTQSLRRTYGNKRLTAEQPDKNAAGKPPSAYVIFSSRRC